MPDELAARDKANVAWITSAFALARAQSSRAVVLAIQANPFGNAHYANVMDTITRETTAFNGEVLLIHGDTHHYRMDQPLRALRNFQRLEVFGYPSVNWVRVHVSLREGKVTFTPTPGG